MKTLLHLAWVTLALGVCAPAFAQTTIHESFESGDLRQSPSGLNWQNTNGTSLVKRDAESGDMVIYEDNALVEILAGYDQNWVAKHGDVAMRFDFGSGRGAWAEQRFSLDQPQQEIWLRYWLRVPENYEHNGDEPSNNKLFALWMDDYSSKGAGPTVIWEFWHDGSGGSRLTYHYSPGGYRTANSHKQSTQFIRYPEDQGRWMQIVMRVRAASSPDAHDGIIQFYRRWEGEDAFRLLHDDQGADIAVPSGGPDGWKAGYFMGWSNPGFTAASTEWLLDDLTISHNDLLETDTTPQPEPEPGPDQPPADGGGEECQAPAQPPQVKAPGH